MTPMIAILCLAVLAGNSDPPTHHLTPLPIQQVQIDDAFWSPKLRLFRETTLIDSFSKFENDRGGAINNFDLVRDGKTGRHAGPEWFDGLIYEMIRAAADFLAARRDPALEERIDGYIRRIVAAQEKSPDGYINTWTQTLGSPSQRWGMNGGDDRQQHDVYNAGALVEAGVHYYRATGKPALLAAATRLANLMCETIGPPPRANVIPGHSLAEEALVKLYRLYRERPEAKRDAGVPVEEERYLKLAEFFIDARGNHEGRTSKSKSFGEYGQDHAPLAQQMSIEGHAVRATLFAAGIAAAAYVDPRPEYLAAARRLWDSLARRRMYITGAAGSVSDDEKFGPDHDLPNDGYMETCAAVGAAFFHHRMNLLFGEARHADEIERVLYNAALGGVSLSGTRYCYQYPLAGESFRRWDWHPCPCCPPMLLKLVGMLPGAIYAQDDEGLYVNLFIGSRATASVAGRAVAIEQTTRYPWEGEVRLVLRPEGPPAEFDLNIRIPEWCQGAPAPEELYQVIGRPESGAARLRINGHPVERPEMRRGYARLRRAWRPGDAVEVSLDMPVRRISAHPRVEADRGLVALQRGPVVYCLESADNPGGVRQLFVPPAASFSAEAAPGLLGGVMVLKGKVLGLAADPGGSRAQPAELTAVPFFASSNREPGSTRVWLPADAALATPATLASRSRPSASHSWRDDSVAAINDGAAPEKSSDSSRPRFSFWDHKGTTEWVQLDFPAPAEVSTARVFWFADRPAKGGCDLPQSWRLLYREGEEWKPVDRPGAYDLDPDRFNEVKFSPVTTAALRIEVRLRPDWSAGICEWQVE